jgi:hypothetical protein
VERLVALLVSPVLACLYGSRIPYIVRHDPFALAVLRLCWFPEIHTRAQYLKSLVHIEDLLDILGTGHVHNSKAERMATLIPQNMREHHRAKGGEGLTEFVIGAKVGQPTDMDTGTHVEPSR